MMRYSLFLITILLTDCRSNTINLAELTFTEDARQFIEGLPVINSYPHSDEGKVWYYFIRGTDKLSYDGIVFDDGIELVAIEGVIKKFRGSTNKTETTLKLLETLRNRYGKGTMTLDNDVSKQYEWKVNDMYIFIGTVELIYGDINKRETGSSLVIYTKDVLGKDIW